MRLLVLGRAAPNPAGVARSLVMRLAWSWGVPPQTPPEFARSLVMRLLVLGRAAPNPAGVCSVAGDERPATLSCFDGPHGLASHHGQAGDLGAVLSLAWM